MHEGAQPEPLFMADDDGVCWLFTSDENTYLELACSADVLEGAKVTYESLKVHVKQKGRKKRFPWLKDGKQSAGRKRLRRKVGAFQVHKGRKFLPWAEFVAAHTSEKMSFNVATVLGGLLWIAV